MALLPFPLVLVWWLFPAGEEALEVKGDVGHLTGFDQLDHSGGLNGRDACLTGDGCNSLRDDLVMMDFIIASLGFCLLLALCFGFTCAVLLRP